MSMFTIAGAPTIEEGDMELIFSDEVTSGTQGDFITGTLPTGYKGLKVLLRGRSDRAVDRDIVRLKGISSTMTARRVFCTDSYFSFSTGDNEFGECPGANAPANFFSQTVVHIIGHESSTGFKTYSVNTTMFQGNTAANRKVYLAGHMIQSTSPITSLTIGLAGTAAFVTGSSIAVYGLK
tara:strand:+ start:454 stop:993 length:540 start_codon:yes stop_codon:yes gene_type:complete